MKTINNVQKVSFRLAAVIASFILISLTVSAQGFWREFLTNNSFGEIAEAMANSTVKYYPTLSETNASSTAWFSKYMVEATESSLKIEDWMLDESNFSGRLFGTEEAVERPLELESWMVSSTGFGASDLWKSISTEETKEKQIQLESWMVENKFWK